MMKERTEQDEIIKGKIATALRLAMKRRHKSPEEAASLLRVELGTLYKYLAGDMIPGGQVLWRACEHLGMILDEKGLRATRQRSKPTAKTTRDTPQIELPFINESVDGDKVRVQVRRKDNQYVVSLRIEAAG